MNKNKLLFVAIAMLLAGCQPYAGIEHSERQFRTIKIEGCQYLIMEVNSPGMSSYSVAFSHKGNCKNPIHAP